MTTPMNPATPPPLDQLWIVMPPLVVEGTGNLGHRKSGCGPADLEPHLERLHDHTISHQSLDWRNWLVPNQLHYHIYKRCNRKRRKL